MNRFKMFMMGRYGTDQLTMAILILGMILSFIANAASSSILTLITYVLFGTCVFRMLSKNISARRKENYNFLKIWDPINTKLQSRYKMIKENKTYKYFKCPHCKKMLRAPRGKGKIVVTCQECKTKFIKKV